mgnify:CR=1 FL=1
MEKPPEREPEQPEEEEVRPQCTRCGAELTPGRGASARGTAGVLLAVAGVCASGFLLLDGRTQWLPAAVAAFILGVELSGDRCWWECPDCGSRFRRRPPAHPDVQDHEKSNAEG